LAQQGQFNADLSLRDKLGTGQLAVDQRRADNEAALAKSNMGLQLAQVLSGMTPDQFNRFLDSQGIPRPGGPARPEGEEDDGGDDDGGDDDAGTPAGNPPKRVGVEDGEVVGNWVWNAAAGNWFPKGYKP
jgi:hypothetical protein